jgi:mycothiol synthase
VIDAELRPRPYEDERDLARMRAVLVQGRRAGGPAYYVHVGDLDWWLFYLHQEWDRGKHIFLWEAGEEVRAWSLFSPDYGSFDLFVDPRARSGANLAHMLAWTEARMAEIVRAGGGDRLRTMWVAEADGAFIALLEARGFRRAAYHLIYMTRSLAPAPPLPEPPLPPGYAVRHVAGPAEAPARAAASHAAFESSRPSALYLQRYTAFMRSPAYRPERDLVVAAPDGRLGAFCIIWPDAVNRVGLFEPVGTHPDFQRQGLGKAVVAEGLRRLQALGMAQAMVCAEHDNPAAQRLYAAAGFRPVGRILTFERMV